MKAVTVTRGLAALILMLGLRFVHAGIKNIHFVPISIPKSETCIHKLLLLRLSSLPLTFDIPFRNYPCKYVFTAESEIISVKYRLP